MGRLDACVSDAIILLKSNEPLEGYFGCFSGGKDSIVIKQLAKEVGVKATWNYNVTTIDPPELIYYIREHHKDVIWLKNKHGSLLAYAVKSKGLPTRGRRWCCSVYKEKLGPKKCTRLLGIRIAESRARKDRYTSCTMPRRAGRKDVYPIRLWEDSDVWDFIRDRKLPYCELYDQGFSRLGCVGCPQHSREKDFARWPGFKKAWRRANDLRFANGSVGVRRFTSADDMWDWWLSNKSVEDWHKGGEENETL